jgi:hypothetical protein
MKSKWFTRLDGFEAVVNLGDFSTDVFVKSRIIWQFFDGHERHISKPAASARS